jgi:acyl-CoA reductase-like NAD-dependent aldehyde dehydrogenase
MKDHKIHLLIDNRDVFTDQYTEVRDPGRLSDVVGCVAKGNVAHVDQAVRAAHEAFMTWRKTPLHERLSLLAQAAALLEKDAPFLAVLVSRENGMLLGTTKAEIALAVHAFKAAIDVAQSFFQPQQVEDQKSWVSVEKRPIGVIAGIVPWNAPIVLTMQKLAPALAAGNTIVIKPSPFASMGVSIALKQIAALFPPGVINVVHGDGDVGSALTTHPLVRKISFTGGGRTAKQVMKDAAESLKEVHFELGGNDPAIVLDDADVDDILPQIVNGVFRRSGQVCFAIKRIYVPHTMYESFYRKMCELVDEFKIGHELDENATLGPVNNRQQFAYVKELIGRIKQSPAKLVELGKKLEPDNWHNGYYLQPAVVRDVEPDQEIVACEQFGPVIPLVSYRSEEEVIAMANRTEYGLGSSIWSADFDRALRIAREIEAGMTSINGYGQTPLGYRHMPFGGVKQSGIGRENSAVGMAEFIEYHAINYHR